MIRKVLKENKKRNKELRKVSSKVVKFDLSIAKVVIDLRDTMRALGGVGIAAPQIGIAKRIIVLRKQKGRLESDLVMINPKILEVSKSKASTKESCLSVPRIIASVQRVNEIYITYQDQTGAEHKAILSDQTSIIFQHELDHLNGILFIDHLQKD